MTTLRVPPANVTSTRVATRYHCPFCVFTVVRRRGNALAEAARSKGEVRRHMLASHRPLLRA